MEGRVSLFVPMAITTFTELVAAVGDWLERSDLSARASDFITLAEAQMNRTLRVRQMESRATSDVGVTDEFSALPNDFLEEKSLKLSDGSTTWALDPLPAETLEEAEPRTGRPTHYALVGDAIHYYPAPDRTYTATLIYYGRIPPLGETQQTNWLLAKAPDAYLYGALTHAAPFLEDDTGTGGMFASLYGAAVAGVKSEQRTKVGKLTTEYPAMNGGTFNINTGDL